MDLLIPRERRVQLPLLAAIKDPTLTQARALTLITPQQPLPLARSALTGPNSSADFNFYDSLGYLLNGSFTQIADNGSQGSGFSQFNVLAGDTFGFRVFTLDDQFGPGIATISNFSAPVPGPLPLLGVGAAFSYSRLRRRINLSTGPLSSASGSSDQP